MLETSQLQTLVAVARAESFSRAAEDLNVTQSAISQSVKNLETKIGVKAFKRTGKKVVLTQEGEKLYELATNFLNEMDETLVQIKDNKDEMKGKIRIGTLTGVGKSWLANELLTFAENEKDLSIHISLGFQEDLIKSFEENKIDFLVLPEGALPKAGEKLLLSEEAVTLVYPKGNPFNITEQTSLDELTKMPTVLFEQGDRLYYNWCVAKYGKKPKKVNVRYSINSHGNMLQAVKSGLGIAVVPNHVLKRWYYSDEIETLGKAFEVSNDRFYIVYHKESTELVRIRKTIEMLTKEANPFL